MKQPLAIWTLMVAVMARSVATAHRCITSKESSPSNSFVNYPVKDQLFDMKCSTTNLSLACTSPWQYCDRGQCTCGKIPHHQTFQCKVGESLRVFSDYCVTMTLDDNTTGYSTFIGKCIYQKFYNKQEQEFNTSQDLNDPACGRYNRTGILCGACEEGLYPLVYSFDMNCVKCSNKFFNGFKFVMVAFMPLTIFYFIVVLLNISISNSYLTGYVLCCQGMVMPTMARLMLLNQEHKTQQTATRVIGSMLSIWNLDTFRFLKLNICLGTDSLQTLALDLVVGIYPLLLIILSYVLIQLHDKNVKVLVIAWKPFKIFLSNFHKTWKVRTSLIDAFSTFLFLSNMKFLNVSLDLLTPIFVYQLNSEGSSNYSIRLYYDATVLYFGKRHLPYGILAIVMVVVFVITPTLLLILYPFRWFQKLLNLFPFRWYVLHTFMDTYQGCFKDGTEPGTRDYRWFSSSFLLIRIIGIILGMLVPNVMYFSLVSLILAIAAILFIVIQPYKSSLADYSSVNASFILLLAIWYMSLIGYYHAHSRQNHFMKIPIYIIDISAAIVILSYLSANILKWMWKQRGFGVALIESFNARRQGYSTLN